MEPLNRNCEHQGVAQTVPALDGSVSWQNTGGTVEALQGGSIESQMPDMGLWSGSPGAADGITGTWIVVLEAWCPNPNGRRGVSFNGLGRRLSQFDVGSLELADKAIKAITGGSPLIIPSLSLCPRVLTMPMGFGVGMPRLRSEDAAERLYEMRLDPGAAHLVSVKTRAGVDRVSGLVVIRERDRGRDAPAPRRDDGRSPASAGAGAGTRV